MCVRQLLDFPRPARFARRVSAALPGWRDPVCGHRLSSCPNRIKAEAPGQEKYDSTYGLINNYLAIEAEANRFASELLMPSKWVRDQILSCENPLEALFRVFSLAAVSLQA